MRQATRDRYRRVEIVCTTANEAGKPRSTAVAETFGISTGAALNLIQRARDAGYAVGDITDHHRPTTAMIHRGRPNVRRWLVCEQCLTPWPCTDSARRI